MQSSVRLARPEGIKTYEVRYTRHCRLRKEILGHFNTEKSEVALFDRFNNSIAIYMRMDGFILEKM